MSIAEALASIPEPEGVTLYRVPPLWESEGLTVKVAYAFGTAGIEGRGEMGGGLIRVGLDHAHDLSWRGPEVYVWPESGGVRGVTSWRVSALGFIEQEAQEAFKAVCAAIDGAPAASLGI